MKWLISTLVLISLYAVYDFVRDVVYSVPADTDGCDTDGYDVDNATGGRYYDKS